MPGGGVEIFSRVVDKIVLSGANAPERPVGSLAVKGGGVSSGLTLSPREAGKVGMSVAHFPEESVLRSFGFRI